MARRLLGLIATIFAVAVASGACAAEGGAWSVSKSSGEVWMTNGNVQQASLKPSDNLKPGDTIRTGRNGRVLLYAGRGKHFDRAEFGDRAACRTKGRAVDDNRSARRLDPARGREAQRQAFRGRNPLSRRRGQGHPVPRVRERHQHQRRCHARTGEVADFKSGQIAPDSGPAPRPRSNTANPAFH